MSQTSDREGKTMNLKTSHRISEKECSEANSLYWLDYEKFRSLPQEQQEILLVLVDADMVWHRVKRSLARFVSAIASSRRAYAASCRRMSATLLSSASHCLRSDAVMLGFASSASI